MKTIMLDALDDDNVISLTQKKLEEHYIRQFILDKLSESGMSKSRFSELMGMKKKNKVYNGKDYGNCVTYHSIIEMRRNRSYSQPRMHIVERALNILGYELAIRKIKQPKLKLEHI